MLNEGNQIQNFISSSCSGTVINYGSGSDFYDFLQVTVPVPVTRCSNSSIIFDGVLKVTDQKSRIRICYSEVRIRTVPKCHGSATLVGTG
jgi:hypothetical protein